MVIAKNQLFSEVPDFETPEWINLYKEPEEVIRTVGPNTFIIKPKNNKVYINGFLIPTKEWQRVIDGEEVEVTDDDGKTVTIVKRNDEIFFNEKPFTSETQPITTTIIENENPEEPRGSETPRSPFGTEPGPDGEGPEDPRNPRKNPNGKNPDGNDPEGEEPEDPRNSRKNPSGNNPEGNNPDDEEPVDPKNPIKNPNGNNPDDEEPVDPRNPDNTDGYPGTDIEEPGSPGNPRKYNPEDPNGEPESPVDPKYPREEEPGKPNRPKTPGKLGKKSKITDLKTF